MKPTMIAECLGGWEPVTTLVTTMVGGAETTVVTEREENWGLHLRARIPDTLESDAKEYSRIAEV